MLKRKFRLSNLPIAAVACGAAILFLVGVAGSAQDSAGITGFAPARVAAERQLEAEAARHSRSGPRRKQSPPSHQRASSGRNGSKPPRGRMAARPIPQLRIRRRNRHLQRLAPASARDHAGADEAHPNETRHPRSIPSTSTRTPRTSASSPPSTATRPRERSPRPSFT